MIIRDNLEELCLFKLQVQKRIARGNIVESKCTNCKGYDLYCDDYTNIKYQKEQLQEVGRGYL